MLRIDRAEKRLTRLSPSKLSDADHWERQIQDMICTSPDAFCEEIEERLWVIGQEVRPSDTIADRIDILAVDEDGCSVIIELKRGTNKLQLLQAISYAGMVSRWPEGRFVETLAQNYKRSLDEARSDIEEHIGPKLSTLNNSQRIILIAEDFDPALLMAAEWLHDNYGVDIRCYRIALSKEDRGEYLTCTCIYPPIEIASLTRRGERASGPSSDEWPDWDAALEGIDNPAMVSFYRKELGQGGEYRLRQRELIYRFGGKRRFYVGCRQKYAYVWQAGRFPGDLDYWKKILSAPLSVTEVEEKQSLRFHLFTQEDYDAFGNAMKKDMGGKQFSESADLKGPEAEQ